MAKVARRSFVGAVERMRSRLNWLIIRVPVDVKQTWGTRGMFKVKLTLKDHEFRATLFPTREGKHFILVNKKMQAGARIAAGARARVAIEPDPEARTITIPPEFAAVLKHEKRLQRWFGGLSHSVRKWIVDIIAQGKHAATRRRKAEQMAELLLQTMDAEAQLPPFIQRALDETPYAAKGWKSMTPTQRRQQLMAVFYYRGESARRKRLEKVLAMAAEKGEKAG